jgi:segregation and condensation protein B
MVMRLVRDDDYYDSPMTLDQEEQSSRAGHGSANDDGDADAAADTQLLDARDGTAIDAADEVDDASESADAAAAPQVNLASLEALLLSTHHPLTAGRLAELLDLETTKPLRKAIKALNEQYAGGGRSFRIEQVAGGFQILTLPEHGELLKKFHQKEGDAKLTKAAIETLAIIAYKQPILRADVEAIRGVACGETIRSLMEKRLVKIAGRAEEPGRPILYGTTKRFLELFGLNSIKDLPQPEALLEKANA